MTARKPKPAEKAKQAWSEFKPNNALQATYVEGEKDAVSVARAIVRPNFHHGAAIGQIQRPLFGPLPEFPGVGDFADAVALVEKDAENGDLAFASRMLAAQAVTLDNLFAEMARRAAINMGEHLNAMEIYARTALKAQAGSRATLEALAKLHQPREQTVRHVHVNEGGQAVIADQFHNHTGGQGNGKSIEQPHAQGARSTALPGPDTARDGVPIPCGEGQATVQDARREG